MIRFDAISGKFVARLQCAISYETTNEQGHMVMQLAEGLGDVYITPAQLADLVAAKTRSVSTWHHEDGRAFTIGCHPGKDWELVWHGTGGPSGGPFKVSQSGYREFVSARRSEGFRLMPLLEPVAGQPPMTPTRNGRRF